jgi:hypothetical protein
MVVKEGALPFQPLPTQLVCALNQPGPQKASPHYWPLAVFRGLPMRHEYSAAPGWIISIPGEFCLAK